MHIELNVFILMNFFLFAYFRVIKETRGPRVSLVAQDFQDHRVNEVLKDPRDPKDQW